MMYHEKLPSDLKKAAALQRHSKARKTKITLLFNGGVSTRKNLRNRGFEKEISFDGTTQMCETSDYTSSRNYFHSEKCNHKPGIDNEFSETSEISTDTSIVVSCGFDNSSFWPDAPSKRWNYRNVPLSFWETIMRIPSPNASFLCENDCLSGKQIGKNSITCKLPLLGNCPEKSYTGPNISSLLQQTGCGITVQHLPSETTRLITSNERKSYSLPRIDVRRCQPSKQGGKNEQQGDGRSGKSSTPGRYFGNPRLSQLFRFECIGKPASILKLFRNKVISTSSPVQPPRMDSYNGTTLDSGASLADILLSAKLSPKSVSIRSSGSECEATEHDYKNPPLTEEQYAKQAGVTALEVEGNGVPCALNSAVLTRQPCNESVVCQTEQEFILENEDSSTGIEFIEDTGATNTPFPVITNSSVEIDQLSDPGFTYYRESSSEA